MNFRLLEASYIGILLQNKYMSKYLHDKQETFRTKEQRGMDFFKKGLEALGSVPAKLALLNVPKDPYAVFELSTSVVQSCVCSISWSFICVIINTVQC